MSVPIQITMSGQMPNAPYQLVTWTVWNAPDNTGAQSGFGANVLQNIGVQAVSAPGTSVNPIALTVGGDLSGTLPNPSVSSLQGVPVAFLPAPITGQLLQYDGSKWTAVTLPKLTYVSFKIDSGTISLFAHNWSQAPSLQYNQAGLYAITCPGAVISTAVWCNYSNVSAGVNNGYFASAVTLNPLHPSSVSVSVWDSLDALPADPADPDDIVTVFFWS